MSEVKGCPSCAAYAATWLTDCDNPIHMAQANAYIRELEQRLASFAPAWSQEREGKLWSFFRRLMTQGGDIQMDYNAGKYPSYEHYSARLDEAARERTDEFLKMMETPKCT